MRFDFGLPRGVVFPSKPRGRLEKALEMDGWVKLTANRDHSVYRKGEVLRVVNNRGSMGEADLSQATAGNIGSWEALTGSEVKRLLDLYYGTYRDSLL